MILSDVVEKKVWQDFQAGIHPLTLKRSRLKQARRSDHDLREFCLFIHFCLSIIVFCYQELKDLEAQLQEAQLISEGVRAGLVFRTSSDLKFLFRAGNRNGQRDI